MSNTGTYPLSHNLAAATATRGSFLTYLRAGTLSIWFFSLIVRYWWLSDWFAVQEEFQSGANVRLYYFIGFAVALVAHLTLGIGTWFAAPFSVLSTWSGRLLTAFFFVAFVASPLSLVPQTSAMYALATWGVFVLLCLFWSRDYRIVQRMVVFAGIVVVGWIYLVLLKHGLTLGIGGGAIGGMNRNTTALATVGGAVCCMLSPYKSIRWLAMAAMVLIAAMVTSRGSIVAIAVFLATYYLIQTGSVRLALYTALPAILISILFIASPQLRNFILEDIFQLHNEARGIGSGFTGRVDAWKQAIDAFWDKPVLGYGFRATTHGRGGGYGAVHSGYLKILVETGFVGFILVITAIIVEGVRRLRIAWRFNDLAPGSVPGIDVVETARINTVACATLALIMTIWVYDQFYINLGSVISIVLFLMIASPVYITTQGVPLRR